MGFLAELRTVLLVALVSMTVLAGIVWLPFGPPLVVALWVTGAYLVTRKHNRHVEYDDRLSYERMKNAREDWINRLSREKQGED